MTIALVGVLGQWKTVLRNMVMACIKNNSFITVCESTVAKRIIPYMQARVEMAQHLSLKMQPLSIAIKLALVITAVIIIGMGLLSLFILGNQAKILNRQTDAYARALGNQLSTAAIEPILAGDQQAVKQLTFNLADNQGITGVALFSDQSEMLSTTGHIPNYLPAEIMEQEHLQWRTNDIEKIEMISYASTILFRDLTVGHYIVTFDRSFMDAAFGNTIRTITFITLLMVILGIITAYFISKRISKPINEIVEGSHQIVQGNHQFQFKENRKDELGQLMNSLNTMTQGLLRKQQVEQTFSRYVSPNVAGSLMDDPGNTHLGGSHVEASVIFADISGFTSISEKLEPEMINKLLNDYFTVIDKVAVKYGGHIDKYIGDCAMILFGAPKPDEEHALNAVKCAVEIQYMIKNLNADRKEQDSIAVDFCIGINSGTMLAGNMGSENRMEYTVVGNAVNLASRLSSIATAGQIVFTKKLHDTLNLDTLFVTSYSNTTTLRGKSKPVEIWQIAGYKEMLNSSLSTHMSPSDAIH